MLYTILMDYNFILPTFKIYCHQEEEVRGSHYPCTFQIQFRFFVGCYGKLL